MNCLKAEIKPDSFVRSIKYAGVVVLNITLKNFSIKSPSEKGTKNINNELAKQKQAFLGNALFYLLPQAIEGYKYAQKNGYPFNFYEAYMQYTDTFNKNCLLSFYYDNYTFTGGAHGNTVRLANTFNLIDGANLPLSAFFKKGSDYKAKLLKNISVQAHKNYTENPNIYFEDYHELIIKYFNEKSFYLTKEGLVIYYGQYDIGPYSSGIQEFLIPYSELDFPPTCEFWC